MKVRILFLPTAHLPSKEGGMESVSLAVETVCNFVAGLW